MPSLRRILSAFLITSLLVGCSSSAPEEPIEPTQTNVTQLALEWTLRLTRENLALLTALPSALFGPYVTSYLTHSNVLPYHGAMDSIAAQMAIVYGSDTDGDQDQTMMILENLGSAIEVDINDLLNRSPEREQTLNEYVKALKALLLMATNEHTALEQRLDDISTERSEKRKIASVIQHDLNQALREKNYSVAGTKQEELTKAEAELAEAESRQKHIQSLVEIYEDLIEVAQERLYAIESNRSALVAGVKVIEVPGTEEIGVLQTGDRRPSGGFESLFDPGGLGGE